MVLRLASAEEAFLTHVKVEALQATVSEMMNDISAGIGDQGQDDHNIQYIWTSSGTEYRCCSVCPCILILCFWNLVSIVFSKHVISGHIQSDS